jgi:hypothetical protein
MKVAAQYRVRVEPWNKSIVSEMTDNDPCPRENRVAACELIKEVLCWVYGSFVACYECDEKCGDFLHVGAETESAYNFRNMKTEPITSKVSRC